MITAIIQARMGSTRLPKKMLSKLGKMPLIEWVLRRVKRARSVDNIILATTERNQDTELVKIASNLNCLTYRGSEEDVLGRFVNAGLLFNSDTVLRVCADNPFVDPIEIDRLVEFFLKSECDYAFNHRNKLNSLYADGFGAEILHFETLNKISQLTFNPEHREHVTQYIWDNPQNFLIKSLRAPKFLAFPELKFDVDLLSDLDALRELVLNGVTIDMSSNDIIKTKLKLLSKSGDK